MSPERRWVYKTVVLMKNWNLQFFSWLYLAYLYLESHIAETKQDIKLKLSLVSNETWKNVWTKKSDKNKDRGVGPVSTAMELPLYDIDDNDMIYDRWYRR